MDLVTIRQASIPGRSDASLQNSYNGNLFSLAIRKLTRFSESSGEPVFGIWNYDEDGETDILSFRLLGTPDEEVWPGVTALPDFKTSFPQWGAKDIRSNVTGIDAVSADLLMVSAYHRGQRLNARADLLD